MLCRLVIIVLLVLVDLRVHAAALKGVILENELSGSPMPNVEVVAVGTNPTVSDADGRFILEFPQKNPGDTVRIIVRKEGYVVVNDAQLQLALPAHANAAPLTVILAKEADREEMVRRFYGLQSFAVTAKKPAETPSKIEDVAKPFLIYMVRWDLLRSFMRWEAFPKDYKELLDACVVNGAAAGVIYFLFVLGLYGIAPARFVTWHEWIATAGVPFSEKIAKTLAPFLLDTSHTLNAVVRRYQERARKLFDDTQEVKDRLKWVPAPLLIDDELLYNYKRPPTLPSQKPYVAGLLELETRLGVGSKHFGNQRSIVSIEGPGGVGKSALAFQIARWASDSRGDYQLARFPILPVLLRSLGSDANKLKNVDEAAADSLRLIMDTSKISAPLLQALLRRKRVLVVVDGVSELPKEAADLPIRPDKGAVDTRFLVVTSRLPTNLPESLLIRPQGLTIEVLDRVLDDLIAANVGSSRFNAADREILRTRIRCLIEDAGEGTKERQVPMIFIKLMIERADQLLNEGKQLDELPTTLAELVTEYTEQLLRNEQNLTFAVQQARIAAHVCMGKERSPAARSENRYTAKGVSKEILDKFVTAGLLVRSGDKSDPFFKFALDPIAEQLDANRLLIGIRDGSADQTEIDDLIQQWEKLPDDFIRALRRAAANYRDSICATQPALVFKLWPEETKTKDAKGIEPLPQSPTERDAAVKAVRSFNEERFDKNPPERAYDSVCEDETSKGAVRWEDHLGYTYEGEPPAIMCQAIQLSGTNISGKPIRIEASRLISKISGESVKVDVGTVDGWMRPEQMHSIPPDSKVTLRATFNAPKGLIAQEFINSWGQCAFLVTYDGANEEIPISEEMTRALFKNFRPEPIAPRSIQKAPNRMNWNKDGTIARSVKGHGYYRIKKQYVPEPGVEEERYLGWYQAGGHAFDPNGGFMPISGPIHGYKRLQEAQRACEEDDETISRHLGL